MVGNAGGRKPGSYGSKAILLSHTQRVDDPIDGGPPGPSIHGIFQARVLEWVARHKMFCWIRDSPRICLLVSQDWPFSKAYHPSLTQLQFQTIALTILKPIFQLLSSGFELFLVPAFSPYRHDI